MKIKKLFILTLSAILLLGAMTVLFSCSEEEEKPCTHQYGEWQTVTAATCKQTGTKQRTCSLCQATEDGVIELAPHIISIIPGTPATCTQAGLTDKKVCSVCELVIQEHENIAIVPHTEQIIPAVKATCKKTGLTEGKKCSVCTAVLVEQTETPIDPETHVEEIIKGVEPTCTSIGFSDGKKCSDCGKVILKREPLNRLDHVLEPLEATAPTCTSWGYDVGTKCSVCKATVSLGDEIPPLDHDFDENGICKMCSQAYTYSENLNYVLVEDDGDPYYIVKGRGECTDSNIIIPDDIDGIPVKKIASGAFYMDSEIGSLKIGKNVTEIGGNAFFSSASFAYLEIPDSVTTIGEFAFDFCPGIKIVSFGKGVSDIDPNAFVRAVNIKRIIISEENPNFKVDNNALYTKDGKTIVLVARTSKNDRFEIPSGVERI